MKVLSISLDKKILDRESENFKRQKEYAGLVNELHIVIFGPEKEIKSGNLFIYGSGGSNKISLFLKVHRTVKKILKNKDLKDWLITTQDPFESALIGWCLSKKFKIGLNIQEHGDYFSEKYWRNESLLNFLRYYLGKFLIKRADSIRVVGQRIKNTLSKMRIDKNRIIVVPVYTEIKTGSDSVDIELQRKHKDKFIFLTLARLVKQKNLPLLIKAFKDVAKKNNQAILLIVGKGPEKKKLVSLAKKLRLGDKIFFIDWTDDIYSYYNLADAYVLSSNYEGWGRVIIEAAGCGLPIIMTDVGCAEEVIKNEKSGLVVPLADKKRLVKAMLRLAKDKNLRMSLAKKAKEEILSLPDKQKTLKLYKESWQKALVKR
jgi:glycosyltransferase involved in cell wall biosynthesis